MKETLRSLIVYILTIEARAVIKRYKPRIVIVTGSVGKTSTKDAVYTALSAKYFVRRSEKSFNSDIGAPLTILGVPNGWSNPLQWIRNILDGLLLILIRAPYPEWLVVEVGADRPGDISRSLAWLQPEVVVATRFPAVPVHVEFYDSPEAVQEEELAPLRWLKPGGVAVVNGDDEIVRKAHVPEGVEKRVFGLIDTSDIHANKVRWLTWKGMPCGTSFDVHVGKERAHVSLDGAAGEAHVYAALAGIAAAVSVGVPLEDASQAFINHQTPPGRMRLIKGTRGTVIIDDSYNASPIALTEALNTLATLPRKGKRIAILGDMLELGSYSVQEHEKIGALAKESADILITVGVRARGYASGAEKAGMPAEQILQFDKGTDAGEHVLSILGEGDLILVKGSQGMRMERISKLLMDDPSTAKKELPRQDAEWMLR